MLKLKFNTNFKTIANIANSNRLAKTAIITKTGLIIHSQDLEVIENILESQFLKLKSVTELKAIQA
jgi:hypothetical protein